MNISAAGIDFIKSNEGFRASAYPDAGGFSIGYGHHILPGQTFPHEITEQEASTLLMDDLQPIVHCLDMNVPKDCTQNQFDALCDFGYNLGEGALLQMLGHGWNQVPEQMIRWVHVGTQVSPGLVARRKEEISMFQST